MRLDAMPPAAPSLADRIGPGRELERAYGVTSGACSARPSLYSSSLIQVRQRAVTAGRELDVHAIPNVGDLLVRSRRLPNNDGQSVFFGVSSTATTLEVRYLLLRQRLDWSGLHPGVGRLGEGTRGEKGKTDACGK